MRPLRRPPLRSCVACRTARPQRELLRVVRAPGGQVGLDATGRANGRGAYVCRDATCIATATSRGALARSLTATIPTSLAGELAAAAGLDSAFAGGSLGQE